MTRAKYMDANILADIKESLLARKQDLEAELEKISTSDEHGREPVHDEIGDDMDENAQEVANMSDRASLVAQLEKQLKDVEKALENMDKEGYGYCKYCKEPINPERLKVRPASGSCVKCKSILQGEGN